MSKHPQFLGVSIDMSARGLYLALVGALLAMTLGFGSAALPAADAPTSSPAPAQDGTAADTLDQSRERPGAGYIKLGDVQGEPTEDGSAPVPAGRIKSEGSSTRDPGKTSAPAGMPASGSAASDDGNASAPTPPARAAKPSR